MTRNLLLALSVALAAAAPALAQDQSAAEDPAFEAAMAKNNVMTVRNVSRTEMARGTTIYDEAGKAVGIVDRLSGNDVVLTDDGREYAVPITEFFAYNQYGKDYFATRMPKAALQAQASTGQRKPLAAAN